MILVKLATGLTKAVTSASLKRAEKKNGRAMRRLAKAKGNFADSNFDLSATQAEVMIQLTKLNQVSQDIVSKKAINAKKQIALEQLLADIDV